MASHDGTDNNWTHSSTTNTQWTDAPDSWDDAGDITDHLEDTPALKIEGLSNGTVVREGGNGDAYIAFDSDPSVTPEDSA